LQSVGVELVVEAYAAAFLTKVEEVPAVSSDARDGLAELRAAVAAIAAEKVSGETFAVWPHQGNGPRLA
jgi:hypothetical protein